MITVYGIHSPHVARLRAALLKKKLEFEHVSVKIMQKSDEFKQLTPSETIPVLQDGDVIASDSIAAFVYLDEAYPETYSMLGSAASEKARVLSVVWAVDRISLMLAPLYVENFADKMRESGMSHWANTYDGKQKDDLYTDVGYRLEKLWTMKGDAEFFTTQFSAADASMLAILASLERLGGFSLGAWKEWKEKLLSDEEIARMFAPKEEQGVREI